MGYFKPSSYQIENALKETARYDESLVYLTLFILSYFFYVNKFRKRKRAIMFSILLNIIARYL